MPTTTIAADELTHLASSALTAAGLTQAAADTVADVLVLADLFGIHTHCVLRVPQYL